MANWHYFTENREKVGPITGKELKQLVQQGTVTPETFVEDPTGRTGLAKDVSGLKFPDLTLTTQPSFTAELPVSDDPSTIAIPLPPYQPVSVPLPTPKQVFCTNCGNPVAEQAVACMSCGAKPTGHKKFCRQCGVALNPEQVICIKCGAKMPKLMDKVLASGNWKEKWQTFNWKGKWHAFITWITPLLKRAKGNIYNAVVTTKSAVTQMTQTTTKSSSTDNSSGTASAVAQTAEIVPVLVSSPVDHQFDSAQIPPAPKELFCTNCGSAVAEQAVACMSCGASPTGHKKFCRQCGVPINPEQVVCIKCGTMVDDSGFDMDSKTNRILTAQLAVQGATLYQARDAQRTNASGHLLIVATSEYHHFLENEFDPGIKQLEKEKNGLNANGCGGCGCLAGAFCGLVALVNLGNPHGDAGGIMLFLLFAAGSIGAGMYVSHRQRKAIQAKIDALHQRKADFERRIDDLKSTI